MTECWEYLESVDRLSGIGGELVLCHGDLHNKKAAYKLQLPVACEMLKRAQGGDEAIRSAIIQKGILPFSLDHVAACTEVIEFSLPTMLQLRTPVSSVHAPLVTTFC